MVNLKIIDVNLGDIKEYKNNPKIHSGKQINQIASSIKEFGFTNPVLLDENNEIIAGHGRTLAARKLNLEKIPAIILSHLTNEQKKAYRIADNKLIELGKWDFDLLTIEFEALSNLDLSFNLDITGFENSQIELLIDSNKEASNKEDIFSDTIPPICKKGDIWRLGRHYLICGDSLLNETYQALLSDKKAQMILTDPPYNLKVKDIGSLGKIKHSEFEMASGEMSKEEFTKFLSTFMEHLNNYSLDGSLHYLFMDWKHICEMSNSGSSVYDELKNVCVWNKTNGGMGSLYRSKHEFCFVFKNGKMPHINNIELGVNGRYRTNVWDYQGVNCFGSEQKNIELHPTVKPVAMLKDAILDVTNRNDIVLDAFLGSGSTLIACEQTNRVCYGIEIDEKYCDITIKRWEDLTGKKAIKVGGIDDRRN